MKKSFVITMTMAIVTLVALTQSAQADILKGNVKDTSLTVSITNGVTSSNVYLSPFNVTNLTTGQGNFVSFCADASVSTSSQFTGTTGMAFGYYNLNSPGLSYSTRQREHINDLFAYAYASAFDSSGNITNATNARAIQLAVWEILGETSSSYNLASGNFKVNSTLDAGLSNVTTNWFQALNGSISWASLGLVRNDTYQMTVYVPENGATASQTMISIVAPTVPEPSSMLFFGLGAIGAVSFFRRKDKK